MSARRNYKGTYGRGNGNEQKKVLQNQNTVQKSFVFHSDSKPSPLLSDRSEFPSLNESAERISNSSHFTGSTLKYSDKLKSQSSSQNPVTLSENLQFKSNVIVTNIHSQHSDRTTASESERLIKNKTDCNANQNIYVKSHSSNSFSENLHPKRNAAVSNMYNQLNDMSTRTKSQRFVKKNVAVNKSGPKQISGYSLDGFTSLKETQNCIDNKIDFTKQNPLVNTSRNLKEISDKSQAFTSNSSNLFATSSNQIQHKKSNKSSITENNDSKETDNTQAASKTKKKQKRKSKVKRQVAFQSGKITVLTPEVHFKILSQTSALTTQNCSSAFTDINDEEEYPELGKSVLPTSQKENLKKTVPIENQKESVDKTAEASSEESPIIENVIEDSQQNTSIEKLVTENKGKNDTKEKVHSYDPITISFFDMLLDKNHKPKTRELKSEDNTPTVLGLTKIKAKKNACHPHNLLDSSSPAIKRGKEREKPKLKKPSQLKKIILLDRKARREHLLQMKSSNEEENIVNDDEIVQEAPEDEDNEASTEKINILDEDNFENDPPYMSELNEINNQSFSLLEENTNLLNLQDDLVSEIEHLNLTEVQENYSSIKDLLSIPKENLKIKDFTEKSTLSCNKVSYTKEDGGDISQTLTKSSVSVEIPLNVPRSTDSLLNTLIGNTNSEIPDKERAAKILLHTRNFREYCNHLISKDIDDAVFALLDDLARFQDRLHQKDPIKARMKRRMIYGVKEVRKHIKLKKLKCIIVAVDIENVEAQGGLNDVLNDIKVSAADHHIPCVFALSRKYLGKVCRKPVPVSCVGVFNYEGSEANFKKMVELQTQSKADYTEIFDKLILKLTDEEAATLLRAKREAPETLRVLRTDILNDFFLQSKNEVENESSENSKSTEEIFNVIDLGT